jgi:DNA-binding helix-hairpin-helix protein with protein kinase domain
MNTGLAILIARTKTHPEEFLGLQNMSHVASKWLTMIENFEFYMTEEEKEAWQEAKEALIQYKRNKKRDDFTEEVMKHLAGVGDVEPNNYSEQLAMSMKNTKQVLEAGLMKTFAEKYKHQDFVNAMRIEE